MQTLIRRRVLWRLIWVYVDCSAGQSIRCVNKVLIMKNNLQSSSLRCWLAGLLSGTISISSAKNVALLSSRVSVLSLLNFEQGTRIRSGADGKGLSDLVLDIDIPKLPYSFSACCVMVLLPVLACSVSWIECIRLSSSVSLSLSVE